MSKEIEETKEFCLDDILNNIDEIEAVKQDPEVTITHQRLNADFTFLIPQLAELSAVGGKGADIDVEELYKVLSKNLVTRITDDMLSALKVGTNLDAFKKIFTPDEVLLVFALLMEGVEDTAVIVKKK